MSTGEVAERPPHQLTGRAALYAHVLATYLLGQSKFLATVYLNASSRLAMLRTVMLTHEESPKKVTIPDNLKEVFEDFVTVEPGSLDAFEYVSWVGALIYITSVFDTFLQDTMEFAFFCHPGAISEHQVRIADIRKAKSTHDVTAHAIHDHVRSQGLKTFEQRITHLNRKFKLGINLEQETSRALAHYSEVRNIAAHDQGSFHYGFDDKGEVVARQKTCPHHPVPLDQGDLNAARRAYAATARQIAGCVTSKLIEPEHREALEKMIAAMLRN